MASFAAIAAVQKKPATEFAPLATPEGITLSPLGLAAGYSLNKETASKLPREEIAFANAEGMTLYTYDKDSPGKSSCVDECAEMWPPAVPLPGVQPVANWSLIDRPDGSEQWAYKGRPLYSFSGDEDVGSVYGNSPKRFGRGPAVGPRGSVRRAALPKDKPQPDGWRAAMFYPSEDALLPGGFEIREVEDAMALVLVEEATGKTLYVFNGDLDEVSGACTTDACRELWRPVWAPRMAFSPKGDFGTFDRSDGIKQWTYKGRALYTFGGDPAFGFANGMGVDDRWQIAATVRYFAPPNVTLQTNPKIGRVLATAEGQTLYRRNGYIYQSGGGHSLRRGDPVRPAIGRDLGPDPRCKIECERWRPFLAPASAKPQGDWTLYTRPDGTKQWASRGYALWTYDGDKAPGDINGNDATDIMVSHDIHTVVDIGTPADGTWLLFWIAAYP
ncbi:MAG: hypothetical protein AB7E79_05950 [Rhodospirillaceae bacterium]